VVPPRKASFSIPRYRYLRTAYRPRQIIASARLRWIVVAVASCVYLMNFLGGDHGLFHRIHLQRELRHLEAQNVRLRVQKERLLREVQLKENDPLSLERLAREKYWLGNPKDQIYRFGGDDMVEDVPGAGPDDAAAGTDGTGSGDGTGDGAGSEGGSE